MKWFFWLAALSLSSAPIAVAQTTTAVPLRAETTRAAITIDARKTIGAVNPHIFGHNVEAGDPQGIFGPEQRPSVSQTGTGLWNPQAGTPVPAVLREAKTVGVKMMRYPGGCLAHNFDWKKAVGPLATRPNFAFGIDEYIAWCRAAGAEPLMNVSDYAASPQDAADLVEYLNAPATARYPWAQKRAAWGHPRPYAVQYFEMGNESDHGNHEVLPRKKWTAAEYVAWYNQCSATMRAIDSKIKMGALMGTGTGPNDPWNETVLTGTRGRADFIIVHTYAVGVWAPDE
ncbi:MAG: alpha-L-arabinofuranosidase, partial [Abditibacteriota bacterium]|nr:alpha-L-arabinofuranosidase [Abditibacteriota bacterium]